MLVLVLLVGGMVSGSFLTFGVVHAHLMGRLDDQLTEVSRRVERLLAKQGAGGADLDRLRASMTAPGYLQPSFVQLRDNAGATVVSVDVGGPPQLPTDLLTTFGAHRPGGGAAFGNLDGQGARRTDTWRVRVVALADGTVLVVGARRSALDGLIRKLALAELVVTAGCVVAVAGFAVPAIRRAMRPLEQIAATARAIEGGDLTRRVPTADPRSEVGEVGSAINAMLGQIESAFGQRDATEQRLRRFVADAAHELRTPVATIRGYAELFRRGAAERPEDLATAMHRIEAEARRMGDLVDELVLLARLDEGRPLRRDQVDLVALAVDAVTDALAVEPGRLIELRHEGPVLAVGDAPRLRQVFANLLGNVARHTAATTAASVSVTQEPGYAVIAVADDGPGMAESDAELAFERFHRADDSRMRDHGGAGLGLAIVAAVAAAHGGSARLTSRPGAGTTVTVRIRGEFGTPLAPPAVAGSLSGVRWATVRPSPWSGRAEAQVTMAEVAVRVVRRDKGANGQTPCEVRPELVCGVHREHRGVGRRAWPHLP